MRENTNLIVVEEICLYIGKILAQVQKVVGGTGIIKHVHDTNATTLAGAYLNGGFGFGKLCLDREFID